MGEFHHSDADALGHWSVLGPSSMTALPGTLEPWMEEQRQRTLTGQYQLLPLDGSTIGRIMRGMVHVSVKDVTVSFLQELVQAAVTVYICKVCG
ncbi:hypothetical protein INR49_030527 [Caranx melampygus]|nr:hypothetical protein INR49_030527 [Caranx melampygus]